MKWHRAARKRSRGGRAARVDSIRITIPGTCAVEDLGMTLLQAVAHLEALRISHAIGINLYVTPANAHGTPATALQNGKPVRSIAIDPSTSPL